MKTLRIETKIAYDSYAQATRARQCAAYAEFLRQHGIKRVYLPPRVKGEQRVANLLRRQLFSSLLGLPSDRESQDYMQTLLEKEGFVFIEWEPECVETTV